VTDKSDSKLKRYFLQYIKSSSDLPGELFSFQQLKLPTTQALLEKSAEEILTSKALQNRIYLNN